jgi:hypothetical protein
MGEKRSFGALAIVTALPLVGLPLGIAITGDAYWSSAPSLMFLIAVISLPHVAASGFFYVDRDYRPLLAANKLRFFGSIAVFPLVMATLYFATPDISFAVYAFYLSWQLHHFQRQNFGLISLAGASTKAGPMPQGCLQF